MFKNVYSISVCVPICPRTDNFDIILKSKKSYHGRRRGLLTYFNYELAQKTAQLLSKHV